MSVSLAGCFLKNVGTGALKCDYVQCEKEHVEILNIVLSICSF